MKYWTGNDGFLDSKAAQSPSGFALAKAGVERVAELESRVRALEEALRETIALLRNQQQRIYTVVEMARWKKALAPPTDTPANIGQPARFCRCGEIPHRDWCDHSSGTPQEKK